MHCAFLKPTVHRRRMSLNAFLVGLTGGIAEGKSTCRRIFEELGALTLDADALAHSVYKKGKKGIAMLRRS